MFYTTLSMVQIYRADIRTTLPFQRVKATQSARARMGAVAAIFYNY